MAKNNRNNSNKRKGAGMAAEVTKGDVERIHERIDDVNDKIDKTTDAVAKMANSVTELTVILRERPRHNEPCDSLKEHLKEHKDTEKTWKRIIIESLAKLIIVGGAAGGGAAMASKIM